MPRITVRALTAVNRSLATRPFSAIAPRYHRRPQHAEQNKNQGDNAAPAAATNEKDEGSGMRRRKGQEPPKLISDIAKLKANMDYVSEAEKKSLEALLAQLDKHFVRLQEARDLVKSLLEKPSPVPSSPSAPPPKESAD